LTEDAIDIEKSEPAPEKSTDGAYTIGEQTMSLFSQAPVVLEPGLIVLEKFRIIDLLGQGGMGSVYRVEHLLMGRQFALKCLNKFQEADASWRRFQNEARAAHLLDHPNLLKVFEFGLLPGGQPFFLMELVEGQTLADEITKLGQLPVDRAVRIFIQVAFAISYAHECKVIHRDIKPSNIMVTRKSEDDTELVKILDFGIAKLTGVDEFNQQTLTKTGEIFGSPLYMSPEQCTGVSVDQRSDLYALGCVFYETLTSAPPFIGESALSTMMKHQTEKPLSLKEASLGRHYPQMLENIVAKLLEKDPANRYQTANALAKDLIKLERRLTEESIGTMQSAGVTVPIAKDAEAAAKMWETSLKPATASLVFLAAGIVFAAGALTSYLVLDPNQKRAFGEAKLFFEDRQENEPKKLPVKGGDAAAEAAVQLSRVDQVYEENVRKSSRWSSLDGARRVYKFPQKLSMGQILTAGGELHDAAGEFSVRKDDLIGLIPSEYLISHCQLMDKFAPDELTLIDMNSSRIDQKAFYKRLANFHSLKFLNVFFTQINNDLPTLSKLPELRYLDIAWNEVDCQKLLEFIRPENLNYLNITHSNNARALFEKIDRFPKLHQLIAAKCKLNDGDLIPLAHSNLKTLCISWNEHITNKGIENLAALKSLVRIDLGLTGVNPEVWRELAKFPNLRTVKIASMKWSGAQKLEFARQMRVNLPKVWVDFDAENYREFTVANTDIEWLNRGANTHDWPMEQLLKKNAEFIDGKLQ